VIWYQRLSRLWGFQRKWTAAAHVRISRQVWSPLSTEELHTLFLGSYEFPKYRGSESRWIYIRAFRHLLSDLLPPSGPLMAWSRMKFTHTFAWNSVMGLRENRWRSFVKIGDGVSWKSVMELRENRWWNFVKIGQGRPALRMAAKKLTFTCVPWNLMTFRKWTTPLRSVHQSRSHRYGKGPRRPRGGVGV